MYCFQSLAELTDSYYDRGLAYVKWLTCSPNAFAFRWQRTIDRADDFQKAGAGIGAVTIGRAPLGLPHLVMRAVF